MSSSTFSHHGQPIERLTVTAMRRDRDQRSAPASCRGTVERLPAEMYLRDSPLAHANGALRAFAAEAAAGADDPLDAMHRLMSALQRDHDLRSVPDRRSRVGGGSLRAQARTGARLRPYLHRLRALPRRAGALRQRLPRGRGGGRGDGEEPGAHCWAEGACCRGSAGSPSTRPPASAPITRYVRVAVGFDARDGGFVSAAHGMGEDTVESVIRIEQAGFQTQA